MKIANKIRFSFFATALIIASIVMPIVYFVVKSDLKDAIYAHLVTTAHSRGQHIETYLAEHKEQTLIMADSFIIEDLLSALIKDSPDLARIMKKAQSELEEYRIGQRIFYEVFIINRDGRIVLSTNKDNIGLDRSTNAYFLGGKRGPYIKDAYHSKTTKKNSIVISAPVMDDKTGEILGVTAVKIQLDDLNEITAERTGLGETGGIYMINKYGYMITESRFIEDTFLKLKVDTENAKNCLWPKDKEGHTHGLGDITISPDYRGVSVLGAHYFIEEMGWGILVEIDEKEALAPLIKLRFIFIATFFLAPIMAWLIGIFISRLLTKSIRKLQEGTKIIGKGNLDYKVGTDSKDEIGQLSRAFDGMTEDLKKSTTSISNLQKEITRREKVENELESTNQQLKAGEQQLRAANQQLRATGKQIHAEITERKKVEEKLNQSLIEATKSREILTNMLDDNNQIREQLENKLEELKQAQKMLVQSEKLASLGNLVSDMAHEVNNPLMVISGRAQLSLMEKIANKDIEENLKIITDQCERAKEIIQSLLVFSRPSKGENKDVNINETLDFVVKLVEHQYSLQDIKFSRNFHKDLPFIVGDEKQLHEVFINVIKNSAEAISGGGSITVATGIKGKYVTIEVSDTGEGISEDVLDKIFDPFFTTKEKGTGLGLSVCYGIIQSHNGSMRYESKPGEGTNVHIEIPLKEENRDA